jgi:hypothetical protein
MVLQVQELTQDTNKITNGFDVKLMSAALIANDETVD